MGILLNIDVPDLARGEAFFTTAFDLAVARRLGDDVVELVGWPVPVYLLGKAAGSIGAAGIARSYDRHWTPVHFDVVVQDIDAAFHRAVSWGAIADQAPEIVDFGAIAVLADPFGNGFCLVEFNGSGYDAIRTDPPSADEA